jgi:predicted nucleic acid-binding protein
MAEAHSILVDINVFIDVTEKRSGWQDSAALLRAVTAGRAQGYISAITKAIIYFRRSGTRPDMQARIDVKDITVGFKIVDLTAAILDRSVEDERFSDVEDAIQFHSAKGSVAVVVTRNKKDFRGVTGEIEVLSPEEFLRKYLDESSSAA